MNFKVIAELGSLGIFSIWAAWTELRLRKVAAKNQELQLALNDSTIASNVKSLSDADLLAKLNNNVGPNTGKPNP